MEAVGIIGAVGEDGTGAVVLDEVLGTADVVFLARPGNQAQRIAQSVAGGVQLGAQPAARAAKTLGMSPPCMTLPMSSTNGFDDRGYPCGFRDRAVW